jgi:serine/threonine protein phosphatase 1
MARHHERAMSRKCHGARAASDLIVQKLTRFKRCVLLPENGRGRDFVVGDLHGHRLLLEDALDRAGFDPRCDRVLSVGDLVDRGPQSLATLELVEEPWFHAVLGNHELMLLNYLGRYNSRMHSKKAYVHGGGAWIVDAVARNPNRVARLAERVASLPLALHVSGTAPFNVTHADLRVVGSSQRWLLTPKTVDAEDADHATSSRVNFAEAVRSERLALRFADHEVQVTDRPVAALPITYVGHSPVDHITVHKSYVYIDQGVSLRTREQERARLPTVLDHRSFAQWLRGVTSARPAASSRIVPAPALS